MSKVFIFMYPVAEYFEYLHKSFDLYGFDTAKSIRKYDKLIDERYRKRGFGIYWVFFSKLRQPQSPDLSLFSDHVNILRDDHIIASGIEKFERNDSGEWHYPDPEFICLQLPKDLTVLAVGGFHGYDCPGKLAEYFHRRGIEAMVDIELTDFLVKHDFHGVEIPVIRTDFDLESVYGVTRGEHPQFFVEMEKTLEQKPWIRQRELI